MQKISTFIRKFDVNHVDGDPVYGHGLGCLLIIAAWVTIYGLIWAMSHQYWTAEYWNVIVDDTLTQIRNHYSI